jgi:hypothetical protein
VCLVTVLVDFFWQSDRKIRHNSGEKKVFGGVTRGRNRNFLSACNLWSLSFAGGGRAQSAEDRFIVRGRVLATSRKEGMLRLASSQVDCSYHTKKVTTTDTKEY